MGRRQDLSEIEKGQIDILRRQNLSIRAIAGEINRGKSCVGAYIKSSSNATSRKRPGKGKILSIRSRRAVVRIAGRGNMTARNVLAETKAPVSLRTMQRILQQESHLVFGPLLSRPKLTAVHIRTRLRWARAYHFKTPEFWRKTVWTDEKRFSLDGPDGHACYWADKRLPRGIFATRQKGGGGVMVWAGISWEGKTELVVVNGTLNAEEYVKMLESHFLPFRDEYYPDGCIFQQDNAPAHTAKHTKDFFMEEEITDMD